MSFFCIFTSLVIYVGTPQLKNTVPEDREVSILTDVNHKHTVGGNTIFMKKLIIHSPKHGKHVVLYDDEDHDLIRKKKWHINYHGKSIYVIHTWIHRGKSKSIKLHQLVTGLKYLDHIDRNGLNNQKKNLRKTNQYSNQHNVGINVRNTTGYKGVSYFSLPKTKHYVASLRVRGKRIHGGYFYTAIEAAKRYNELALRYHGEFAYLNKI